jgi:hypothetical protein
MHRRETVKNNAPRNTGCISKKSKRKQQLTSPMASISDNKLLEGITKHQNDYIWQDREIRFDSRPHTLACRKGETIIGTALSVIDEATKRAYLTH